MLEAEIFKAAIKLPPNERAPYLQQACGDDAALRQELEALVQAHEQAGEFLQRPALADRTTHYGPGPERPGMRIGPYKLLQFLGEGGMGTVFLAEQTEPVRRMVALKIIKPGMDSSQVLARFEAERQALAIMDHPNIAKVLAAGATDSGRPYFVMELVKGVPITDFCDQNKLTTRQRLELFIPVCNAIQHAHIKGIIHRDVKPSNVLIALYDGKPVPKVIDFGVAKAMAEPLTQRTLFTHIGQVVGTFEYMSPEQATLNQLDIDTRSDIYSLGVLLYELLTGLTPLDRERLRTLALDQMLRTIREEEPMRPGARLTSTAGALAAAAVYRGVDSHKLADLLRGELDWIVMKCLEKERDRRFLTAGSLAQDIERYLRDEPVLACPPTLGYRLRKTYRKHRASIQVAAGFAFLLLAGIAVASWLAVRATRAEHAAAAERDEAARRRDETERALQNLRTAQAKQQKDQYAWDMQIIPTAFESRNLAQVRSLLERHEPALRGFEWHYWDRRTHTERRSLQLPLPPGTRPTGPTALSRDGTRVAMICSPTPGIDAAGLSDSVLRVHDVATGQLLLTWNAAEGKVLSQPTFSPDGRRIAFRENPPRSGSRALGEGSLLAVDVGTGQKLLATENLGGWYMPQLSFSPDGRRLATLIALFEKNATLIALSEKKSRLMPVLYRKRATIYDVEAGRKLCSFECEGEVEFSRDGTIVAGTTFTTGPGVSMGVLHGVLWDAATGQEVSRRLLDSRETMNLGSVPRLRPHRFSPDGRRLAWITHDPDTRKLTLELVEVASGKTLFRREFPGDSGRLGFLEIVPEFTGDGKRVGGVLSRYPRAGIGNSIPVVMWDADTGRNPVTWEYGANPLYDVPRFGPDGRAAVVAFGDWLTVRDAETGAVLQEHFGHAEMIDSWTFSADGQRLVSIDVAGVVKEWDTFPPEPTRLRGHRFRGPISPDGSAVAGLVGAGDDPAAPLQAALWSTATGERKVLPLRPGLDAPETRFSFVFSPDGRWVGVQRSSYLRKANEKIDAEGEGDFSVFDTATGKEAHYHHKKVWETPRVAALSPDGSRVFLARSSIGGGYGLGGKQVDTSARASLFDLAAGKLLWSVEGFPVRQVALSSFHQVAFSPDGRKIAFCIVEPLTPRQDQHRVRLAILDTASGGELVARDLDAGFPLIGGTAWSPDGTSLATGLSMNNHLLTILDAATLKPRLVIANHGKHWMKGPPRFSPDGRRLLGKVRSGGFGFGLETEVAKIWDAESGVELLSLEAKKTPLGPALPETFSADGRRLVGLTQPPRKFGASGGRVSRKHSFDLQVQTWDATPRPEASRREAAP